MRGLILIFFILNSCQYPEMIRDELIYNNDFENSIGNDIDGGVLSTFNSTKLLGNYNNDGFTIHLSNTGEHDYVFLSFDLYIHGSWDGNSNGFTENDRADKWIIDFKHDMELYNDNSSSKFVTTFSNSPCWPDYCLLQSYPQNFPFDNNPKKGSDKINLEEKCINNFFGGKTSLYKIEKAFKSNGKNIVIRFYDELYQPNAIDINGVNQQKCDESWSLDNLKIRVVDYN